MVTPRLAESGSRQLSDSPSFSFKHSKADSPTRRVGESSTPRLGESESQRLPDSPSRKVADSPTRRVGESFFDYEYLREFEAKSGTERSRHGESGSRYSNFLKISIDFPDFKRLN